MATKKIHLALAGLVLAVAGVTALATFMARRAPAPPQVPLQVPVRLTSPVPGIQGIPSGMFVGASAARSAGSGADSSADSRAASAAGAPQSGFKTGDRLPDRTPDSPAPAPAADEAGYRKIDWENLIPADWDPMAAFKELKLDEMDDADPRAQLALLQARKMWRDAPVNAQLDGAAVKLAGFVVSLSGDGQAMKEFLLVPYFGACIHVPPPPANQVIHVKSSQPIKGIRTMDAVWISGRLGIERADTVMGSAGYRMDARHVELYEPAFEEIPTQPDNR